MSRTYKTRPHKVRFPEEQYYYDQVIYKYINYSYSRFGTEETVTVKRPAYIQCKTNRPKKRKRVDTENHWMTTPSWWTRLMMTRPLRRKHRLVEHKIKHAVDLDEIDYENHWKKPHKYYW